MRIGTVNLSVKRVLGTAALLVLASSLVGCNKVNKKDHDMVLQENQELRDRVSSLETDSRSKDTKIAELEAAKQQPQAQPGGDDGWAPDRSGGGRRPSPGSTVAQFEMVGDVLFDSGQATVKATAKPQLDRIASQIKSRYSGYNVVVEGHTDSDPIKKSANRWKSNDQLSEARAEAVRKYLITKGIGSGSIEAVGMGSSQPKGSKKDSRRVEIKVVS